MLRPSFPGRGPGDVVTVDDYRYRYFRDNAANPTVAIIRDEYEVSGNVSLKYMERSTVQHLILTGDTIVDEIDCPPNSICCLVITPNGYNCTLPVDWSVTMATAPGDARNVLGLITVGMTKTVVLWGTTNA